MGRMQGRIALVTGGSSGIGQAIALLMAAEGARVVVAARREVPLQETVRAIQDTGAEAACISTDVTDEAQVARMVAFTVDAFGGVDTLVNSAGVIQRNEVIEEASTEDWEWQINTNLRSIFYTTKYCLPPMMRQQKGAIVNIGSISAFAASKGYATYCATKGAIISYTRAVALQYAQYGIRANVVEPGGIQTPMSYMDRPDYDVGLEDAIKRNYPIARAGQPEDVAYAALYLASDEASWVTGTSIVVDGGFSIK